MESRIPLFDESSSTRASHLPRNSSFRSCFKRKWDGICSGLTSAREFIQFGNRVELEPMPSHLKIGHAVEMIEDDGRTFVEATIEDIRTGSGLLLVKPKGAVSEDDSILLQKDKLQPVLACSSDTEHQGTGPHPSFTIYDSVDVLNSAGKWVRGVIVQSPTSNGDSYRVRIFKEKDNFDSTFALTTKMRLHFDWDRSKGWIVDATETIGHPLNQAVGLVGHQRAKIVKMLDAQHAVVEFCDLTNSDGNHVKEVVHIKDWYKSRLARRLKELRYWLAPTDDPLQEFECYMPTYTCLAVLAAVSPVLFTNSAENWPDNMLLVFYLLGGLCCFVSLLPVVRIMCRKPTARTQLRILRLICLTSVAIGVAFLTIHAVYGHQALMASRQKARSVTIAG
ncbi:hypothetical protein SETIT_2G420000v2 [Setaria italica]|uniref:Uncharacterized protein n=2 Tax=Setaria italica TaxID=4555 RepID=A0A368Q8V3_SETIT|nr:uncharacterized protein LOC101774668 [Setaria italica]XP_022679482.1 uncharacterized protein LOC101774668 [Setaria italica]RCV14369.1 hypothetical protein SETIT_2G420000v2 [Setaria italica]